MPDTEPAPEAAITTLCNRAEEHLAELNVMLAYVPDLDSRDGHLLVVQNLMTEIGALRGEL